MNVSKIVNDALVNHTELEFVYSNQNKNVKGTRHVVPTELINGNVLVAVDLDKDGYRRFILDNMSNVREVS